MTDKAAPGERRRVFRRPPEHLQLETPCVSKHTACRFAEKHGFSARFGPGGVVRRLTFHLLQR